MTHSVVWPFMVEGVSTPLRGSALRAVERSGKVRQHLTAEWNRPKGGWRHPRC